MSATVDLTEFNTAWKQYLKLTSKSFKDAANNTLFDIARYWYRDMEKANKGTIRDELNALSNDFPERTVAEMVIIVRAYANQEKIMDLDAEAAKLVRIRAGHAGYTKSGCIQAMKDIAPLLGKSSFSVAAPSTVLGQGGGQPIRIESTNMVGSVYNDVTGKTNDGHVQEIKNEGAQSGVDKVTADKNQYLEKKLAQNARETGF